MFRFLLLFLSVASDVSTEVSNRLELQRGASRIARAKGQFKKGECTCLPLRGGKAGVRQSTEKKKKKKEEKKKNAAQKWEEGEKRGETNGT